MSDFVISQTVSEQSVRYLLSCAWEGGSNYWASADGSDDMAFETQGVVVRDEEGEKEYVLNQKALARGLAIMSDKYPWHWGNFVGKNFDADTGDVFLQCCLLGDVVYG